VRRGSVTREKFREYLRALRAVFDGLDQRERVRRVSRRTREETFCAAAKYRAIAAAYYQDGTITERQYVRGLCAR
jgi:hypothetical protein